MKIGIANDLPMAVEQLRRILSTAAKYKIIWVAKDGREALNLCKVERPDVLLMDLMMPVMDGVEATRSIMLNCPCPILVVSAHNDNSSKIFEAMIAGAVDSAMLPTGVANPGAFLAKIDALSRDNESDEMEPRVTANKPVVSLGHLIVIGASAGGPAALAELLNALPSSFPVPIIIVQHMGAEFTSGLAEWLSGQTHLKVRLAKQGDQPLPGHALVATGDNHLVFISANTLGYVKNPVDAIHHPSIDVFFKSVVERWAGPAIGILLTGMGRDGAAGLKMMRNKGHLTIAQDQASSVVYGMPKAAATMGAAAEILPLNKIAPRLKKAFGLFAS